MNSIINGLLFFFVIIIQFSWTKYFALYGLAPNIPLIALIYISLRQGALSGQLLGFAWGITWDVLSGDLFGSHALLFTGIGFLIGKLSHKMDESKVITQMVLTGIASVVFSAGMWCLYLVFSPTEYVLSWNYIVWMQPLLNMMVAPFFFAAASLVIPEQRA
ncbi:MAG: rod shape-determining protein MreD [Elusimicrobia bacterium]|nr:rod shape-determining protein MreD [Elusimicrobiota bacterium]